MIAPGPESTVILRNKQNKKSIKLLAQEITTMIPPVWKGPFNWQYPAH